MARGVRLAVLALENVLFPVGALAAVALFAVSRRRGVLARLGAELSERFGAGPVAPEGRPVVWVHAASAGEVSAAAPLVKALAARPTKPFIVMTTTTSAGRERAASLPGLGAAAVAPLDAWPCVSRFLSRARPDAVVLIETELWPHAIELPARRGAPVFLVNGRISDRSWPRYRLARPLVASFLARLSRVCAQSEADAERFRALGGKATATGNLKFDAGTPRPPHEESQRRVEALGWRGAPLFVAGSTHPVEEEAVLEAFLAVRKRFPDLKLVVAPRHVERAGQTCATFSASGLWVARWTDERPGKADVLVLDALGALAAFYPLARISFVGGTLAPIGGHNVLEPALAGCPVIFGPYTQNTREPARLLESAGAGFTIDGPARLTEVLTGALAEPARASEQGRLARRTAEKLGGAVARTLAVLEDELSKAGV